MLVRRANRQFPSLGCVALIKLNLLPLPLCLLRPHAPGREAVSREPGERAAEGLPHMGRVRGAPLGKGRRFEFFWGPSSFEPGDSDRPAERGSVAHLGRVSGAPLAEGPPLRISPRFMHWNFVGPSFFLTWLPDC